jgi:hypothetical protein
MVVKFHDSQVSIGFHAAGTISLKDKMMLYENVWFMLCFLGQYDTDQVTFLRISALRKSMAHTTATIAQMAVPALRYSNTLIRWLR